MTLDVLSELTKEHFSTLINREIEYYMPLQGKIFYRTINDHQTSSITVEELSMKITDYLQSKGFSYIICLFENELKLTLYNGYKIHALYTVYDNAVDTLLFKAFFDVMTHGLSADKEEKIDPTPRKKRIEVHLQ